MVCSANMQDVIFLLEVSSLMAVVPVLTLIHTLMSLMSDVHIDWWYRFIPKKV